MADVLACTIPITQTLHCNCSNICGTWRGNSIVLSTVFQAFGKAKISLIISFARQIIILLPLTFILSKLIGLTGVWIAFPISETGALLISGYFAIKVYREKIRDLKDEIQVC